MKGKIFYFVALAVVLLSVSCNKLPKTVRDSIGKSVSGTAGKLEDLGFNYDRTDKFTSCIIYEHGDTLVTICPEIEEKNRVGGIFLTINIFDPEEALETYKSLRKYCADSYANYDCKIIDHKYGVLVESKNPEAIDTISVNYITTNKVNFNERWYSDECSDNRNSIALIRHSYIENMWQVNLIFRTYLASYF